MERFAEFLWISKCGSIKSFSAKIMKHNWAPSKQTSWNAEQTKGVLPKRSEIKKKKKFTANSIFIKLLHLILEPNNSKGARLHCTACQGQKNGHGLLRNQLGIPSAFMNVRSETDKRVWAGSLFLFTQIRSLAISYYWMAPLLLSFSFLLLFLSFLSLSALVVLLIFFNAVCIF